jgi:homoaconitase
MNVAFDRDTNTSGTIPEIAKNFKARNQPWALVVDDNYGEGSAREHAALQPRFYGEFNGLISLQSLHFIGCALILARSFARIHETNLKVSLLNSIGVSLILSTLFWQKQGILPLWFVDKTDYSKIGSGDVLETSGLSDVFEGKPDACIKVKVTKIDGTVFEIATKHTMSADQLNWLKAGSALNYIRSTY